MYSLKDSIVKPKELVKKVKENGHSAVAITDHAYLYGNIELYKLCKKEKIKMIYGCELYICDDMQDKTKDSRNYHLIVLAANDTGRININKLSSIGHIDGFYRKARIDYKTLLTHKEGIIVLSACMAGEVSRALMYDTEEKAIEIVKKYKRDFGDNYYIETQAHCDSIQQGITKN
jgi:DNA polymerase-3 subunit alpha